MRSSTFSRKISLPFFLIFLALQTFYFHFVHSEETIPQYIEDWKGKNVQICVYSEVPYTFYDASLGTGNNAFYGLLIDQWQNQYEEIKKTFEEFTAEPFTYTFYHGSAVGSYNGTGWNGCLGDIANGRAAFALGPISAISSRLAVVDFTSSYEGSSLRIITKKRSEEADAILFTKAFTSNLWVLYFFTGLGMGIVMWALDLLSPYGGSKSEEAEEREEYMVRNSITNTFLVIFGMDGEPTRAWSARLVMIGFFFLCLIVIQTYIAQLTSVLVNNEKLNTPIDSLDAIRAHQYKFGVVEGTSVYNYFTVTSDARLLTMAPLLVPYASSQEITEAIENHEIAAGVIGRGAADWIGNSNIYSKGCEIIASGPFFNSGSYGIPYAKGASIGVLLNNIVLNDEIRGKYDVLQETWYLGKPTKPTTWPAASSTPSPSFCGNPSADETESVPPPIQLADVAGAFYMVFIAAGISLVLLLLEIITFQITKRDEKNSFFKLVDGFCGKEEEEEEEEEAHGHHHENGSAHKDKGESDKHEPHGSGSAHTGSAPEAAGHGAQTKTHTATHGHTGPATVELVSPIGPHEVVVHAFESSQVSRVPSRRPSRLSYEELELSLEDARDQIAKLQRQLQIAKAI